MFVQFLGSSSGCILWLLISSEETQLELTWAEIEKSLTHDKGNSKSGWNKGLTHIFRTPLLCDLCFFLCYELLIAPKQAGLPMAEGDLNSGSKLWVQIIPDSPSKRINSGFPGGTVVENLPANAGDMGSSPGPGRYHMPQST